MDTTDVPPLRLLTFPKSIAESPVMTANIETFRRLAGKDLFAFNVLVDIAQKLIDGRPLR
jgi:hypothetical protein